MRSATLRTVERAAPLFAALGDEVRLRLVARLSEDGPLSVGVLAENSGVTRQAISKHLRVLEGAGLVKGSREGRESVWALERRRLREAHEHLDTIAAQWDEKLGRLKAFVEEP